MKSCLFFRLGAKRAGVQSRGLYLINGLVVLSLILFTGATPAIARSSATAGAAAGATAGSIAGSIASASPAPTTRANMLARALTWVDLHLPYNQSGYYNSYREDCSGFVSMAWGLPAPGLNTDTLRTVSYEIPKDQLQPGDIINRPGHPGFADDDGHTVMFLRWTDSKQMQYDGLEESPNDGNDWVAGAHLSHNIPYPYWATDAVNNTFVPRRFNAVSDTTLLVVEVGLPGISVTQNNTPNRAQQPLEVQVFNRSNQMVKDQQVTVTYHPGTGGYYDLQGTHVPGVDKGSFMGFLDLGTSWLPDVYTVKIRLQYTLRRMVGGIVPLANGMAFALPFAPMVPGDSNDDNVKNVLDYNMLVDCYSDLLPPKNCNPAKKVATDLNEDGKVNGTDYTIWIETTPFHCDWCNP